MTEERSEQLRNISLILNLKEHMSKAVDTGFNSFVANYYKCEECQADSKSGLLKVYSVKDPKGGIIKKMFCMKCYLAFEAIGVLRFVCCDNVFTYKRDYDQHRAVTSHGAMP